MTEETSAAELDRLKFMGKQIGLHVEQHKVFDRLSHRGDLYVQRRRAIFHFEGGRGNPPSLLRYASADEVKEFLIEQARQVLPLRP